MNVWHNYFGKNKNKNISNHIFAYIKTLILTDQYYWEPDSYHPRQEKNEEKNYDDTC